LTVQITFRCPPEWRDLLPRPVPGRQGLPDWLKAMPQEAHSALIGQDVRTVKHCPPFLDAMGGGWLMPLLCDVAVTGGPDFAWDWDLPPAALNRLTRSPISLHVSAQLDGVPFAEPGMAAIKFNSAWTVEVPDGWSVLFTHPVNRFDLPFRTLTGLVDCDAFSHGFVHFPALWTDRDWTGTLPAGTPVAQLWPVPRGVEAVFGTLDGEDAEKVEETLDRIGDARGGYRKNFRAGGG
jgi:hypothetical protein